MALVWDWDEINDLDFDNIGSWPASAKLVLASLLLVFIMLVGYFFVIKGSVASLQQLQKQETELKFQFRRKAGSASNLPLHKKQLVQLEQQLDRMLAMMPSKANMSTLLDELTYLAKQSNLKIHSLNWLPEREKTLYKEYPIAIKLTGSYHDFGYFSAGVAALPRLVSLDDFTVVMAEDGLSLYVLAKTYQLVDSQTGRAIE